MSNKLENLIAVELRLRCHIKTVCKLNGFDINKMLIENEISLQLLKVHLKEATSIDENELLILKRISILIRLLKRLIMDVLLVYHEIKKTSTSNLQRLNPSTNGSKSEPKKFRNDQIEVLDEWYSYNHDHPYLKPSSIEDLHKRTGLSETQVRNWVSHKRRKEKSKIISVNLKPFLM
uniref:MAT homeobox alpha 2 protein n=1 Tax=Suhomyces chickasaworum TaxID=246045 RepID=A0A3Q9FBE4_9ASCO|nr:MAT homeobox alpha 2 protein [Suhomyces chickasaworum]AZQ56696.1 MAT homeobox alpha 2 protein [Suhomyces chickasaworum]